MAVGLGGAPICTRLKILTFQTQEGRIWQLFKPGTNNITTDWPFLRVTSHLTHPYSQAHFEWKDLGPGNDSPVSHGQGLYKERIQKTRQPRVPGSLASVWMRSTQPAWQGLSNHGAHLSADVLCPATPSSCLSAADGDEAEEGMHGWGRCVQVGPWWESKLGTVERL